MVFGGCESTIATSKNWRWALTSQISALVGVEPDHVGTLYTYLINKPQFSTSESRKHLISRLREALVKNVSVQGVCKPLEALFSITKVERPEDQDFSFSRYENMPGFRNVRLIRIPGSTGRQGLKTEREAKIG